MKNVCQRHQKISKGNAKTEIISAMDFKTDVETDFTGYDELETDIQVLDLIEREGKHYVIVDMPFVCRKRWASQ